MTQDDQLWWAKFREVKRPYIENDEYRMICEMHARCNNVAVDYPCKCNPKKIQKMIDELNLIYDKL